MRYSIVLLIMCCACKTLVIKPTIEKEIDQSNTAIAELEKLPQTPETVRAITALRSNVIALKEMDATVNSAIDARESAEKKAADNQSAANKYHAILIGLGVLAAGAGFMLVKKFIL